MPRSTRVPKRNLNPRINTDPNYRGGDVSQEGLLDSPVAFTGNLAAGVATGVAKFGYDMLAFGVDTRNLAYDLAGADKSSRIDIGADFWDAIASVHDARTYVAPNNQVKGWADTTALMGTTAIAFSRLAKFKKFAPMMQSSSKWTQLKGSLYAGALSEIPAAFIHTRSSDGSMLAGFRNKEDPNSVIDWFVDRSGDSEIEGRFKNALEGMFIGAAFEGSLTSVMNMFRSGKRVMHEMAEDTGSLVRMADEVVGTGDGSLARSYLQDRTATGQMFDTPEDGEAFMKTYGIQQNLDSELKASGTDSERLFYLAHKGKQKKYKSKKKRHVKKHRPVTDVKHPEFDKEYVPLTVPRIIFDPTIQGTKLKTDMKLTRAERKALVKAPLDKTRLDLGDTPEVPGSLAPGVLLDDTADVGIIGTTGTEGLTMRVVDPNIHVIGHVDSFLSVPQRKYVDTPAPSAAAARSDIGEYTPSQVQAGLPTEDMYKAPVDLGTKANMVEAARMTNASAAGAHDIAEDILKNGTPQQRKEAQRFLDDSESAGLSRLNIETNGDDLLKRGARLAQVLKINTTFRGDSVPKRSVAQLEYDTAVKMASGKLGIQVNKLAAEYGVDAATMRRQLANLVAIAPDAEEIITAVRKSRSVKTRTVERLAAKLEASGLLEEGVDVTKNEDFRRFVDEFLELDEMDWGLQGVIGSAGRILRMQQENPSTMGNVLRDLVDQRKAAKLNGEAIPMPELTGNLAFFAQMLDDPDQMILKATLRRVAKGGQLTNVKAVQDLFKGRTLFDWFKSIYLGGLLASSRTVIGAVGLGGVTATAWKQIAVPTVEGLVGSAFRSGGARLSDPMIAAGVLMKQSWRMVENVFAGDSRKSIGNLMHIGWDSTREGLEDSLWKHREIKEQLKITAKNYSKEGHYKLQKMTTLMTPIIAPLQVATNVVLRRIGNIDDAIKGLNNMAGLEVEANRAWRREGAQAMFPNVTKPEFVNRFMDLQQKIFDIDKLDLDPDDTKLAVEKLFEGKPNLMEAVLDSIETSQQASMEATLQQSTADTFAGTIFRAMNEHAKDNVAAKTAVLATAPFQKTPVNMLSEVIDHSPLAWTSRRFWNSLKHGTPEDKLRTFSKMAAGTMLQSSMLFLAAEGRLQGTIAPKDRQKFEGMGIGENSIFIAGTWYDYSNLGPLGVLLSSAANVTALQNQDIETTGMQLLGQTMAVAGSESHLRIFKEIIDVVQDPNATGAMADLVFKKATSMLTPMSGAMTNISDILERKKYRTTLDREIGGLADQLQASMTHGLRSNALWRLGTNVAGGGLYEAELDVMGDDVHRYGETGMDKFLHLMGIGNTNHKKEPYVQQMVELGYMPANSSTSTVHGVPLTANEFKDMNRKMMHGDLDLAGDLNKLVTSEFYTSPNTSREQRKALLGGAIEARKKYIKELTFQGSDRLKREKFILTLKELKNLSPSAPADYESEDDMFGARVEADRNRDLNRFKKELNMEKEK